jgi:hypothetical protein
VNAKELDRIKASKPFIRIAGFGSSAFATWAPKLYDHYEENLASLLDSDPKLRRNFHNSVFSSAAFNFGLKTVSAKHRDYSNLPYGWCPITALGDYDPTRGGHLVLWELKMVIEFPPGSTVLIPSAVISHSNTPIHKRETRFSFTQYTAGGLFRWAEYGFQQAQKYSKGMSAQESKEFAACNAARCKRGLSLFSTLAELKKI